MLGTALAARTIPASMVERVKKVLNTPGENGRKNHLIRLTFVGSSTTEPVLSAPAPNSIWTSTSF